MEVRSEFVFEMDNNLQVVYQSLLPELEAAHQRTRSELSIENNSLLLTIHSEDLISMRAALNGWLRLINIAVEMTQAIEK